MWGHVFGTAGAPDSSRPGAPSSRTQAPHSNASAVAASSPRQGARRQLRLLELLLALLALALALTGGRPARTLLRCSLQSCTALGALIKPSARPPPLVLPSNVTMTPC